jgi:hypothetical protein
MGSPAIGGGSIEHIAGEDFQEVDAQNEYLPGSPSRLK